MPDEAARDPHTLLWGRNGEIWFTVQGGNKVGRFEPGTGNVRLVDSPTEGSRPYGIVQAPDGTIWVAAFGTNKLLRLDEKTMALQEIELPRADARPRRLQPTSDGRIWYGDYAAGKLGVYDPEAGTFEEWDLPGGAEARPYAMAVDEMDRLWVFETGPRGDPNTLVGFDPETERFVHSADVPSGGGTVRHLDYHEPTRSIWFGTDENTIGVARLPR
jgi:virginiamycin B lyase